jgi:hypothetical protein
MTSAKKKLSCTFWKPPPPGVLTSLMELKPDPTLVVALIATKASQDQSLYIWSPVALLIISSPSRSRRESEQGIPVCVIETLKDFRTQNVVGVGDVKTRLLVERGLSRVNG